MQDDIYDIWLHERNEAVRDAVKECYQECKKMFQTGDASEEDFSTWRQKCIHALSPAPLRKYFREFAASSFTKHNLRFPLDLLSRALEHVNRPDFALPNLRIDCYPAFEASSPEVLLGME